MDKQSIQRGPVHRAEVQPRQGDPEHGHGTGPGGTFDRIRSDPSWLSAAPEGDGIKRLTFILFVALSLAAMPAASGQARREPAQTRAAKPHKR